MTQIKTDQSHPRQSVAKTNQKNNEYSNRFGEPVPALVTTLVVAPFTMALRMVAADADGFACL